MLTPFELMIANAVRKAEPGADDAQVARVIAGVCADPDWRDLTFLTPQLAEGMYATQLAARAVAINAALKKAASRIETPEPATPIHARFDMTTEEFRALPPQKKRELREAAAKHDEREAEAGEEVAALKAKLAAGTITPTEKLTLGHLTAPTKAEKRTPNWQQAQEAIASLPSLRSLIRGHEQVYGATSSYPKSLRDHHEAEANRLRTIIREREAAGEA